MSQNEITKKDIGKRVSVTGTVFGEMFDGESGIICDITNKNPPIGVNFDKSEYRFHECGGSCERSRGYYVFESNITFLEVEFKPDYYSGLNSDQAKDLIGKRVQFSDNGAIWRDDPEILEDIRENKYGACFRKLDVSGYWTYIRTVPETFQEPEKEKQDLQADIVTKIKAVLFNYHHHKDTWANLASEIEEIIFTHGAGVTLKEKGVQNV